MKAAVVCALMVLSAVVGLSATAKEEKAGKAERAAFGKIAALAGEWEVKAATGDREHGGTVQYKLTAGESAVLETLFGGSEHEMLTVYYMDGDDLALTHYCMLHNRPQMRAKPSDKANQIVFACQDQHGKIEGEDHMHQVTFTFVDADHVKTEWVLYKAGKADSTHTFELARKKK